MDDIFILPVSGRKLLFSPLRNVAGLVNAAGAEAIATALEDPASAALLSASLQDLAEALKQPISPVAGRQGPPRPPFLGLILTRACNLACRYCDFRPCRGDDQVMTLSLVKAAVDTWVEHMWSLGENYLKVEFFGGEPFVEPDLVQLAVHRTRAQASRHGLRTHFEACTNGFFDEPTLRFVTGYFDTIVLSLDGRQSDHDRHRPLAGGRSSFERVCRTAQALSQSPVELCLRCCVSEDNVARMPEIADWFASTFQPGVVNFEPLVLNAEAEAAGLRPPDPLAFATGLLRARRRLQAAGIECSYSALFAEPRATPCPLGQDTFIVAANGNVRSCYLPQQQWIDKGLDLEIGRVAPEGLLEIDQQAVDRLRRLVEDRARCQRCFCRWGCAGGCLVSETYPGHDLSYTDFCVATRLIQACVLLEAMGLPQVADALLGDSAAVNALCRQPDDRYRGCP